MPSANAASSIAFSTMFFPWTSPKARNAVLGAVLVRQTSIWLSKLATVVGVVGAELDAVRDDERAVVERAAIAPHLQLEAVDDALVLRPHVAAIDRDLILAVVGVALADHRRVLVARDGDAHGALGGLRGDGRRADDEARLFGLAAEPAADRRHVDLDLVVLEAERHRGGLVHLHRALRRGPDADAALVSWDGDARLRLHVEVHLAAVGLRGLDHEARGAADRRLAAHDLPVERLLLRRPVELAAGPGDAPDVRHVGHGLRRIREDAVLLDGVEQIEDRLAPRSGPGLLVRLRIGDAMRRTRNPRSESPPVRWSRAPWRSTGRRS